MAGAIFSPFIIVFGAYPEHDPQLVAHVVSNLGVTAALAIMALVTIELSGLFKLGFKGYMRTIFPSLPGMGGAAGLVMSVAMGPIEILGKLVKPFALCFRLFGNMTAGQIAFSNGLMLNGNEIDLIDTLFTRDEFFMWRTDGF